MGPAAPLSRLARVVHSQWGGGTLQHVDGDSLTVLFDDVGYKALSAELVLAGDLIRVQP